tara:strand:+ start:25 stop:354 length:330 start_codon:yes stop_codon:yes gene_type:complete
MVKLKDLLKESSPGFENRKFGDPLPKLEDITKRYQEANGIKEEETVKEAAPQMRAKPGQKELKAIKNKLEGLKDIDISTRHYSKLVSALKNAQNAISKVEKVIQMSSRI